jgi:hypothetical protein
MKTFLWILPALLFPAGAAAQEAPASPIATDRPGFLFSSLTVGRGVLQAELGLPAVTLDEEGGARSRFTSLTGLLRYGLTGDFELRLGAPVYGESRLRLDGRTTAERGFGDLEAGAKWHVLDNDGAVPSLALIPSVILPTGETGFSAEDPVYQLNVAAEWAFAGGWGLAGLAGHLDRQGDGPAGDGRYQQQTFALSLGRSLPSPRWSAYGEAAYITTGLDAAADVSFAGAGLKYLIDDDAQLDLSFDRGLDDGAPDWLLGLGFAARF